MPDWLNRLAKWRSVLTGWQLGTRPKGDPESDAVRDINEARLIQRAELTALTRMMIERGVFTPDEFRATVQDEARLLCKSYEHRFPGFEATDEGMSLRMPEAAETTKRYGFKP